MRTYEITIRIIPSVLNGGEIMEETVLACKILADRNAEAQAFAEQLFSLWENSNIMGDAQKKWKYELTIEQE